MADIADWHLPLTQEGLLEGEDAQHQVHGAAQALDPPRTPGPDRRTDQVGGGDAGPAQAPLQGHIEVRGVDADEEVRWLGEEVVA